jgi:hypothetical protein
MPDFERDHEISGCFDRLDPEAMELRDACLPRLAEIGPGSGYVFMPRSGLSRGGAPHHSRTPLLS